ncbi:hypothetical protein HMPREF9062_1848 [Actinomyces sp. oral taxon 448 str. F0400]|nr:hypothetical protein HMPREF9062_1848 [Actinomyces sp. oral taxon 448 str. F0400]
MRISVTGGPIGRWTGAAIGGGGNKRCIRAVIRFVGRERVRPRRPSHPDHSLT